MLGLERVLSEKPPHLASGTELRRHQVDALAGMLTELIAAVEKRDGNGNGNGNGTAVDELADEEEDEDDDLSVELEDDGEADDLPPAAARPGRRAALPLPPSDRVGQDDRRRRLRRGGAHRGRPDPHSPPPARDQFRRELTDHGYGDRLTDIVLSGSDAAAAEPDHDPDLRLVRAARRRGLAHAPTSS